MQSFRRLMQFALRAWFMRFVHTTADKGHLEVERKFNISADEALHIPGRAASMGFKSIGTATMRDTFLPAAISGEMLRVRRETLRGETDTILTFKQWVQTPDGGKERRETERKVGGTIAALWLVLGRLISAGPLWGFGKERQLLAGNYRGLETVIGVDDVNGLGRFSGTYLEVEVIVPLTQDPGAAREAIFALVTELLGGPRQDVKQSYMDMLAQSKQVLRQ